MGVGGVKVVCIQGVRGCESMMEHVCMMASTWLCRGFVRLSYTSLHSGN